MQRINKCIFTNNTSSDSIIYSGGYDDSANNIKILNCVIYDNNSTTDFSIYGASKITVEGGTLQNKWFQEDGTAIGEDTGFVAATDNIITTTTTTVF